MSQSKMLDQVLIICGESSLLLSPGIPATTIASKLFPAEMHYRLLGNAQQ
jgi:hypothetical protein